MATKNVLWATRTSTLIRRSMTLARRLPLLLLLLLKSPLPTTFSSPPISSYPPRYIPSPLAQQLTLCFTRMFLLPRNLKRTNCRLLLPMPSPTASRLHPSHPLPNVPSSANLPTFNSTNPTLPPRPSTSNHPKNVPVKSVVQGNLPPLLPRLVLRRQPRHTALVLPRWSNVALR